MAYGRVACRKAGAGLELAFSPALFCTGLRRHECVPGNAGDRLAACGPCKRTVMRRACWNGPSRRAARDASGLSGDAAAGGEMPEPGLWRACSARCGKAFRRARAAPAAPAPGPWRTRPDFTFTRQKCSGNILAGQKVRSQFLCPHQVVKGGERRGKRKSTRRSTWGGSV
jgi:hypothetical protein